MTSSSNLYPTISGGNEDYGKSQAHGNQKQGDYTTSQPVA